ncbi:MAG: ParB/RepB/Spo0J family partition protein [Bacteroidota bacterium]|nr:ParB/RepB/Spo0J family partition protein [Bacillota bacterium]MDP4289927.1 ParB/RepB/Spo0J family partition protein [Bacteroidota bacterium]
MINNNKKKALGRGLSAILSSPETDITSKDISGEFVVGAVASIPIDLIETNPFQPRDQFEEDSLSDLAHSIKEQGIIQPITVRKMGYDKYQLISGERRLRASKLAGLEEIPAYIRVANDQQMLEMALVENIQREQLNSIEVAISFQRLLDECNLTQEQLSERVGKNRTTVSNFIRLLKLAPDVQVIIRDGLISMGHARALITIDDTLTQLAIAKNIINKGLSVRETELIVRNLNKETETKAEKTIELPEPLKASKNRLNNRFGTKVDLHRNEKGKGSIVITFKNDNELNRILTLLGDPTE